VKWRIAALLVPLLAPPAFAHGDGLPIAPAELWHHWNFDPLIWIPLLLAHWLYGRGVSRAWARAGRGRVIGSAQLLSFAAGEIVIIIALMSPLDPLGETLLSAHMMQHILLTAVAPPLLLLSLPQIAWMWALPRRWRRASAAGWARRLAWLSSLLEKPLTGSAIAIGVMWFWHAPAFFEAALEDETVHTLEHLTFFTAALLGWRATVSPRVPAITAAGAAFLVFMAGGMLGGVLTLAPAALYDWYGNRSLLWGLSPVEDQQMAGILMWVVAGGIYLVAFGVLAFRAADPLGAGRSPPSHGIIRANTSSRSMK
jgi:putative membrane protein